MNLQIRLLSMKKTTENPYNLKNLAPLLYKTIQHYQISKIVLAKFIYAEDWDENSEDVKHKLTVRLRNKLDGQGKMTADELVQIQNYLLEMADTIKNNVNKFIVEKNEQKQAKIKKLIEHFDKVDDASLDKMTKNL